MIPRPFCQLKHDLSIEYYYITWKGRFFIPAGLRSECLQTLNNGQPNINKMQLRSHTSMYWPTINKEIADNVQSCVPCQTIIFSKQKEPAIPIEVPSSSRKTLGMDLFLPSTKGTF